MSKAFTREDEGAGFDAPEPSQRMSEARLTAYGARILEDRLAELERERDRQRAPAVDGELPTTEDAVRALQIERMHKLLADAEVLAPPGGERVALGAVVRFRDGRGNEREVAIVTPDEVGLVPSGVSGASPLATALLGAAKGDEVELETPRGVEELTVLAIRWPT